MMLTSSMRFLKVWTRNLEMGATLDRVHPKKQEPVLHEVNSSCYAQRFKKGSCSVSAA